MSLTADIKKSISHEWERFEQLMSESLVSESRLLTSVNDYLLSNAGKRIRPLLALLTAKACSGLINEKSLVCATVSELIHTATLLHDDVVDDSDYRRGKPTVNRLLSPGTSLLMGDYWLTKSIHLMIVNDCPYSVMSTYAKALENLAEGEMIQMECADRLDTGLEDYLKIIRRKTSSLFIASIKSPAIVSGASEETVEELTEFADCLGICFQIRDDILDYHPSSETGKDSDSDIAERKITLPLLCAFRSRPEKESYIRGRMSQIQMLPKDEQVKAENREIIAEIKRFVLDAQGVSSAMQKLREYVVKALGHLSVLEESLYKEGLKAITEYLGRDL